MSDKTYKTLREMVVAEGLTRDDLLSSYSDMYKSLNGIRPRWNYDLSLDNLIEEMEMLARIMDRKREKENEREREERRGLKIQCVECDCPTRMFTVGKVYNRGENWLVEDDLGHARFVNSDLQFLIGSCGATVHLAHFQIVES